MIRLVLVVVVYWFGMVFVHPMIVAGLKGLNHLAEQSDPSLAMALFLGALLVIANWLVALPILACVVVYGAPHAILFLGKRLGIVQKSWGKASSQERVRRLVFWCGFLFVWVGVMVITIQTWHWGPLAFFSLFVVFLPVVPYLVVLWIWERVFYGPRPSWP